LCIGNVRHIRAKLNLFCLHYSGIVYSAQLLLDNDNFYYLVGTYCLQKNKYPDVRVYGQVYTIQVEFFSRIRTCLYRRYQMIIDYIHSRWYPTILNVFQQLNCVWLGLWTVYNIEFLISEIKWFNGSAVFLHYFLFLFFFK